MGKQVFSVCETKGMRESVQECVCAEETPCENSQARDSPTHSSRSTIMLNN